MRKETPVQVIIDAVNSLGLQKKDGEWHVSFDLDPTKVVVGPRNHQAVQVLTDQLQALSAEVDMAQQQEIGNVITALIEKK